MAIDGVFENLTSVLSPELLVSIGGLVTILKAVGVFAIIYVIYVVIMGILGFRSRKRMKIIEKRVIAIDKKIDKLLKSKKK